jgi:hypothetical protein
VPSPIASLFTPTVPVTVTVPLAVSILLAAAALSIPRALWQYFGLFTTLVHELGHAVAAIVTGRIVRGIRIHRNHSGDAVSSGRGVVGATVSGLLGYPAPAIVGLVIFWGVLHGYTALVLFCGGVILVLTIIVIRNLFGALVVIVSAAISAALWFYATPPVQSYALLALATALLVGAVRGLITVVGVHIWRRGELATSDAYLLAKRTGVPSFLWLTLFAACIGGCCVLAVLAYIHR